jgi:hypothetical protein
VSQFGLVIYILKYVKAKEKFHHAKIESSKNPLRNQNPSRYHNSITNLKFQHRPKCHLSKILI